jgi:hypothetical protein
MVNNSKKIIRSTFVSIVLFLAAFIAVLVVERNTHILEDPTEIFNRYYGDTMISLFIASITLVPLVLLIIGLIVGKIRESYKDGFEMTQIVLISFFINLGIGLYLTWISEGWYLVIAIFLFALGMTSTGLFSVFMYKSESRKGLSRIVLLIVSLLFISEVGYLLYKGLPKLIYEDFCSSDDSSCIIDKAIRNDDVSVCEENLSELYETECIARYAIEAMDASLCNFPVDYDDSEKANYYSETSEKRRCYKEFYDGFDVKSCETEQCEIDYYSGKEYLCISTGVGGCYEELYEEVITDAGMCQIKDLRSFSIKCDGPVNYVDPGYNVADECNCYAKEYEKTKNFCERIYIGSKINERPCGTPVILRKYQGKAY